MKMVNHNWKKVIPELIRIIKKKEKELNKKEEELMKEVKKLDTVPNEQQTRRLAGLAKDIYVLRGNIDKLECNRIDGLKRWINNLKNSKEFKEFKQFLNKQGRKPHGR